MTHLGRGLVLVVLLTAAGCASGQTSVGNGTVDGPRTDATAGEGAGDGSRAPVTLTATDADIGFLQDMFDHHGQAVLLGSVVARRADDEQVRALGLEIAVAQAGERGEMHALLVDRGAGPGAADRMAMAWAVSSDEHDHGPMPLADMPGMIPPDDLAAVQQLSGAELDRRFLELMIEHHRGGVAMAELGGALASDPVVVALADRMVSDQERELTELLLLAG